MRTSARRARFKEINYASEFVEEFSSLRQHDKVLICCVVSFRDRKQNLVDQENNLRQQIESVGADVEDVVQFIGQRYNPTWVGRILGECQDHDYDWVLFETTDRILRHPKFNATKKGLNNLHPTREQWKELSLNLGGHKVMSHLDPKADAAKIRSYQRKRGLKKQSQLITPKKAVLELYSQGKSVREISEELDLPKSTVHDLLKQSGM